MARAETRMAIISIRATCPCEIPFPSTFYDYGLLDNESFHFDLVDHFEAPGRNDPSHLLEAVRLRTAPIVLRRSTKVPDILRGP
jgi:hypothetical protein